MGQIFIDLKGQMLKKSISYLVTYQLEQKFGRQKVCINDSAKCSFSQSSGLLHFPTQKYLAKRKIFLLYSDVPITQKMLISAYQCLAMGAIQQKETKIKQKMPKMPPVEQKMPTIEQKMSNMFKMPTIKQNIPTMGQKIHIDV